MSVDIEKVIKDLSPKLKKIAYRFVSATNSMAEVDDIVQESLITLWELDCRGYEIKNIEALAKKIVKTICVEHYRKQKITIVDLNDYKLISASRATDTLEDSDNEIILADILNHLTPTERLYIQLRNLQGLSLDEIVEATGKPKNSIKVTLSNARLKLLARVKEIK